MGKDSKSFLRNVGVYVFYMFVVYFAHFKKCAKFGLYEDDYHHVAYTFFENFSHYFSYIQHAVWNKRGIGYLICSTASYLSGAWFESLVPLYALGVFIVALNGFLVYSIAGRYLSFSFAFLCGALFILSPADTTKEYLTHIYFLQTSLLFSLSSVCLFRHGKRTVSYFLAALSLLTYESAFIVFFFAELLAVQGTVSIKRNVRHLLCCSLVIACAFAYKITVANDVYVARVVAGAESDLMLTVKQFAGGVVLGPFYSGQAIVRGVLLGIKAKAFWAVALALCLGAGAFFSLRLKPRQGSGPASTASADPPPIRISVFRYSRTLHSSSYFFFVALLFLPCAYLLSITHYPPATLVGRLTSEHLAATVAWALVLGAGGSMLWNHGMRKTVCVLCFIVLLGSYQYAVIMQKSYVDVAKAESAVLGEIERLCPDMRDADGIIVEPTFEFTRPHVKAMRVFHWALPLAGELRWGKNEDGTPRVPLYKPQTIPVQFRNNNGQIEFYNDGLPHWGAWVPVTGKTIFLVEKAHGGLRRFTLLRYNDISTEDKSITMNIRFKSVDSP